MTYAACPEHRTCASKDHKAQNTSIIVFYVTETNTMLRQYVMVILQVSQHNLVHHGDWWSCTIDVLETAFVLDYVLSDSAKRAWDNNNQQVGCARS